MKRAPRSRQIPANLPASLQQKLSAYAVAAGVAGVSLLALAPASEAKVVYTPANAIIGHLGSYNLDLNNDGITDFVILERASHFSFESFQILSARAGIGNQVNCPSSFCISGATYAASLTQGSLIGPNQREHGWLKGNVQMAFEVLRNDGGVGYTAGSTSPTATSVLEFRSMAKIITDGLGSRLSSSLDP
jgi:hypothetical protein